MPSPGEVTMTATPITASLQAGPRAPVRPAVDLLHEARARERAASIPEAIASYQAAVAAAERAGERAVLAEALRRLAVLRHRRGESAEARELCRRSHAVACHAGNPVLAGEALNTLGGIDLETDAVADARGNFLCALELGGQSRELRARVEQNLGILADIQGDRDDAEAALATFDQLDALSDKADAYRVLGMVFRETGRPALAEARLRSAIELAVSAGALLNEAEASRELALLYQSMGRNQEALTLLNAAPRLFGRLDTRLDVVHVDGKMAELEATYLSVVHDWGQSIESSDPYTFGHCERVARRGVTVARALGMDAHAQTTVRLGAYLHDLGKVRVPHEILSKPGPLTRDEFEVIQMHPIWGIELLAGVELPWDIKPIIRWHHERYDGTGYPDRLRGDEIPLSAQIVGIVDVYDALTTARPYRLAFSHAAALATIRSASGLWSRPVYAAFLASLAQPHALHAGAANEAARSVLSRLTA